MIWLLLPVAVWLLIVLLCRGLVGKHVGGVRDLLHVVMIVSPLAWVVFWTVVLKPDGDYD